jgi:hypothetical protein
LRKLFLILDLDTYRRMHERDRKETMGNR